jgi:hypothetical protein
MKRYIIILIVLFTAVSCEDMLDEEVFSDLGPSNFYQTAEDAEALLNASYAQFGAWRDYVRNLICMGEQPTDILLERKGGIHSWFGPMEEYTWNSAHSYLLYQWTDWYNTIFRANVTIDHVPDIDMDPDRREQIVAEARFIRGFCYFSLYDYFGPVPLITSSEVEPEDRPARATDAEFVAWLENEFIAISQILPRTQEQFPRPTKGAALGYLAAFYLNHHKWSEAAAAAKTIIDEEDHYLYQPVSSRYELFSIENEGHPEFMWVVPYASSNPMNTYISHSVPDNYKWKYNTLTNFAADFRTPTAFINTFDPNDTRLDAFVFKYEDTNGDTIVCAEDDIRSFKFGEDPNAVGDRTTQDVPLLRFAEILLIRAEALNMMNGPNQESIDLINQVREVAGIPDFVLADFPDQQSLTDEILDERAREFFTEGKRRTDLIRQGQLISNAQARGWPAQDYHKLFPIPQVEINANENLEQNPGY